MKADDNADKVHYCELYLLVTRAHEPVERFNHLILAVEAFSTRLRTLFADTLISCAHSRYIMQQPRGGGSREAALATIVCSQYKQQVAVMQISSDIRV